MNNSQLSTKIQQGNSNIMTLLNIFSNIFNKQANIFLYPLSKEKIKLLNNLQGLERVLTPNNPYFTKYIKIHYAYEINQLLCWVNPNWENDFDSIIESIKTQQDHNTVEKLLLHVIFENHYYKKYSNDSILMDFYNSIDLEQVHKAPQSIHSALLLPSLLKFIQNINFNDISQQSKLNEIINFIMERLKYHGFSYYRYKAIINFIYTIDQNINNEKLNKLKILTTYNHIDLLCQDLNATIENDFVVQANFHEKVIMELNFTPEVKFTYHLTDENGNLQINNLRDMRFIIQNLYQEFNPVGSPLTLDELLSEFESPMNLTMTAYYIDSKQYNAFWIFQEQIMPQIIQSFCQNLTEILFKQYTANIKYDIDELVILIKNLCKLITINNGMPKEELHHILQIMWETISQYLFIYLDLNDFLYCIMEFTINVLLKIDSQNYQPIINLYNEVIQFLNQLNQLGINLSLPNDDIKL